MWKSKRSWVLVLAFYLILKLGHALLFATVYTRLAGTRASRDFSIFTSLLTKIREVCDCAWDYVSSGDTEFHPHAFTASECFTDLSPKSLNNDDDGPGTDGDDDDN